MSIFRRAILILIMLWLPLQSTTAAVIALCAEEKKRNAIKQVALSSKNAIALPCAKANNSSDESTQLTITITDKHQTHQPSLQHPFDQTTSSLQCNDILCQINYTTLVLASEIPVTFNGSIDIQSFVSGFMSFVSEQPQRPPIS